MMHKACSSIEEVPYCFSRSSVQFQGHTALKIVEFGPNLGVSGLLLKFWYTNGSEIMHKAWSRIEEVLYCFSRSFIKFQGHTALKIVEFDPNWAFPDCNYSLNSPMAMKCCTKLETAKERCPIVFQGHPSNLKVIPDKTSPILTQIVRFRTTGRSQLSNPSDLPCLWLHFSKVLVYVCCAVVLCLNMWQYVKTPHAAQHWHVLHTVILMSRKQPICEMQHVILCVYLQCFAEEKQRLFRVLPWKSLHW